MLTRRSALLASAAIPFLVPAPPRAAAALDPAHRHDDAGRHPGDRLAAPRPGHRRHPLHAATRLYDPLVMWDLVVGDGARQLVARASPPSGTRTLADPDEVDLRIAPGREIPSRRTVHCRRCDLQPRAHAERQVAGLRPARPRGADRSPLADRLLSQARHLQDRDADQRRRHGDALAAQPLHHRQRRQFREGRQGLAGLSQVALRHRPVEDEGLDAARARRARSATPTTGTRTAFPRASAWCCCRSPTSRRAAQRCCPAGSTGSRPPHPIRWKSSRRPASRSRPTPFPTCGPTRSRCCRARRPPISACARR